MSATRHLPNAELRARLQSAVTELHDVGVERSQLRANLEHIRRMVNAPIGHDDLKALHLPVLYDAVSGVARLLRILHAYRGAHQRVTQVYRDAGRSGVVLTDDLAAALHIDTDQPAAETREL